MLQTTFDSTRIYTSDPMLVGADDESLNTLLEGNALIHSLEILKEFSD